MPPRMIWLVVVVRLASAPLFVGALGLGIRSEHSPMNLGAAVALLVLGAIQLWYWWRPWPGPARSKGRPAPHTRQGRAVVALGAMVPPIALLQHVLHVPQPLLWLYPAIIAGSGLAAPLSAVVVGLMAFAAVVPDVPVRSGVTPLAVLGSQHAIFLSIVLAGLGMVAVRQLMIVNAELQATRAELAELAVARERERLARDLHDLLGRTLSLIAVKAELAHRLSAGRAPSAEAELREVQQLARQAVRDVREALTACRTPTISAELAAARLALGSAGVEASVVGTDLEVDPANEATLAWALREAVTNVVKHSGARHCWITLKNTADVTMLEVVDDGRGPGDGAGGSGLPGLADRIHALGGTLEAGPSGGRGAGCEVPSEPGRVGLGGFRVRVTLGARALEPIR